MGTLGLTAPPTRKADSIWRNLFWPTIRTQVDVDQIGRQGFWLCFVLATFTLVFGLLGANYKATAVGAVFYLLGGMGVRQRSRIAAVAMFTVYFLGVLVAFKYAGPVIDIVYLIFLALLLANVRGTFLSAMWRRGSSEAAPPRGTATVMDRLADQMPMYVWPAGQWLFYLLAAFEIGMILLLFLWPEMFLRLRFLIG